MKRKILIALFLCLCAVGIGKLVGVLFQYDLFGRNRLDNEMGGELSPQTAYILSRENWTVFPVPLDCRRVNLISNLDLGDLPESERKHPWSYAVEYSLLDSNGRELMRKVHYLMSTAKLYESGGRTFSENNLAGTTRALTGSRILRVNLEDYPTAARFAVRTAYSDAPVRRVLVRFNAMRQMLDYKLDLRWARMNVAERQFLARGQVYPPDLLSEYERNNLMGRTWSPLGPLGSRGKDYDQVTISVWRNHEGKVIKSAPEGAGTRVGALRPCTIPLPETGGNVRLVFSREVRVAKDAPAPVVIRWYGRSLDEYDVSTNTAHDGWSLERHFDGGLLEIDARDDWTVQAYLSMEGGPASEIVREDRYLRVYRAESDSPLSYKIIHATDDPLPFRLSVRQGWDKVPEGTNGDPIEFSYQMRDEQGEVIRRGDLVFKPVVSLYDRTLPDQMKGAVSDGEDFFFAIPTNCSVFTVLSQSPLLVCAFNRPPSLTKLTLIPESQFGFDPERGLQPSWFSLRPEGYAELRKRGSSELLLLQDRPPESAQYVMEGDYDLTTYEPVGESFGQYVLIPQRPDASLRPEGLSTRYYRVPPAITNVVEFSSVANQTHVRPSLIYIQDTNELNTITVTVDGEDVFSATVADVLGEMSLPPVKVGRRNVRVSSDKATQAYLNFMQPNGEDGLAKRMVYKFETPQQTFAYEKHSVSNENLSVVLFAPSATTNRIQLFVDFQHEFSRAPGPFSSWTISSRVFDVRPDDSVLCPLLNSAGSVLSRGQRCVVPVGSDLPPGRYSIRFLCDVPDGEAFMSLARLDSQRRPMVWGSSYMLLQPNTLRSIIANAVKGGRFVAPDKARAKAIEKVFDQVFEMNSIESLAGALGAEGFGVEADVEGAYNVIRELPGQLQGRGVYCLRVDSPIKILLQAPHGQKDIQTGDLVRLLMEDGAFAAAALNTVPRWYYEDGRKVVSDVADLEDHCFTAFTRSFTRSYSKGVVVQIHGFDSALRKTRAARESAAIISSGSALPSELVVKLAGLLGQHGFGSVLVFPQDTRELGGTLNAQGLAMRRLGSNRFIHMELSRALRASLINNENMRKKFIECLQELYN